MPLRDTVVTLETQDYHPGTLLSHWRDRDTTLGRCSHTGETGFPPWDTVVTLERQGYHPGTLYSHWRQGDPTVTLQSHWRDRDTTLGHCSHTRGKGIPPWDTVVILKIQGYHTDTM